MMVIVKRWLMMARWHASDGMMVRVVVMVAMVVTWWWQ